MKNIVLLIVFGVSFLSYSQKDSLKIGDKYLDDQLYVSITYNFLIDRPTGVPASGFSYGLSAGYIRDIPFSKSGKLGAGVGVGYSYDSFNHGLQIDASKNITFNSNVNSGKIRLHTIEMPIQFRWRSSDAVTYSFWRLYSGVRLSYNFHNLFKYEENGQLKSFKNINSYQKFQAGLELSFGYDAFNFYVYYPLTSMHDITINQTDFNMKAVKAGLIFYIL